MRMSISGTFYLKGKRRHLAKIGTIIVLNIKIYFSGHAKRLNPMRISLVNPIGLSFLDVEAGIIGIR